MKSASRILIIVGAVFSFLAVVGLTITAIVFLVMSGADYKPDIMAALEDGSMTTTYTGTTEEMATAIQGLFRTLGIVFIVIAGFYVISPTVSLIASGRNSKPLFVVGLVLSLIGFDVILILGNVFGLVDESK